LSQEFQGPPAIQDAYEASHNPGNTLTCSWAPPGPLVKQRARPLWMLQMLLACEVGDPGLLSLCSLKTWCAHLT
jgi:hypothetical protein